MTYHQIRRVSHICSHGIYVSVYTVFHANKALSSDLKRHVCVLPDQDGTSFNKSYSHEKHCTAGHIDLKGSCLRDQIAECAGELNTSSLQHRSPMTSTSFIYFAQNNVLCAAASDQNFFVKAQILPRR